MKNFFDKIVRKIAGKSAAPDQAVLGQCISLKEAKNIRHKRFAVINKGQFAMEGVPENLQTGEVLWALPFDGFGLLIEEHHGGCVHSLRLHLDFEKDNNFATLVKGKTELTEADIRPLVAKEWIALAETEQNQLSLNVALEKYGLRCSDLQFNIERDISVCSGAINYAGKQGHYVFLPKENGWECWQDSERFSVTQNRFIRREDLETLLPQRVGQEEAKTEKYIVERNGKQMFFTFGKEVTFGRSREQSIYFSPDKHPAFARISNNHCLLADKNGKLILMDTSTNGTVCDGHTVRRHVFLCCSVIFEKIGAFDQKVPHTSAFFT